MDKAARKSKKNRSPLMPRTPTSFHLWSSWIVILQNYNPPPSPPLKSNACHGAWLPGRIYSTCVPWSFEVFLRRRPLFIFILGPLPVAHSSLPRDPDINSVSLPNQEFRVRWHQSDHTIPHCARICQGHLPPVLDWLAYSYRWVKLQHLACMSLQHIWHRN